MSDQIKQLPLVLQVVPTEAVAEADGVELRMWQGVDAKGNQYLLLVHRAVALDDGAAEAMKCLESREALYEMVMKASSPLAPASRPS